MQQMTNTSTTKSATAPVAGTSIDAPSLAQLTDTFRGLGGWLRKQNVMIRVTSGVPDFFDRCPTALLSGDQELLSDLKSNFRHVFSKVVAKGASISPEHASGYAKTLEGACELLQRRLDHITETFSLASQQGLMTEKQVNSILAMEEDGSSRTIETLTKLARCLHMYAHVGDMEQSRDLSMVHMPQI